MALLNTLPAKSPETPRPHTEVSGPLLQNLIPIAMVIVGGCEPCAEKMVKGALELGSSWQDIDKALLIIADMQKRDCFGKAVGPEIVARMEKSLAAGRRTLQQAINEQGR